MATPKIDDLASREASACPSPLPTPGVDVTDSREASAQPAPLEVPKLEETSSRNTSTCSVQQETDSRRSSTSRLVPSKPKPGALKLLFAQDVSSDWWLESQLLFMTFITGVLDAVTFTQYHVFTTKQTGNFLNIAIYVFSREDLAYKVEETITVSIVSFFVGSFLFGQLAHYVRTRKRGWLILTTFFQAIMVLVSALVERSGAPNEGTGPRALAVVGLLSFAQAGQVSLAIGVGMAELNTTMITGAIISTLGDPNIFRKKNHGRDRRVLLVIAYLAGCFVGTAMNHNASWVFFLAFGLKMLVCGSFFLTPGMVPDVEKQANTPVPITYVLWGD